MVHSDDGERALRLTHLGFFTPPLHEALAESNYFHIAALPAGAFLQKKPVPLPGA